MKINKKKILQKLAKGQTPIKAKAVILAKTKQVYYPARQQLFKEIDAHPVSQELNMGSIAPNISGTLPRGYGNLFSFIGFDAGSRPVEDLKKLLNGSLRPPTVRQVKDKGMLKLQVTIPAPIYTDLESEPATSLTNYTKTKTGAYTNRSWLSTVTRSLTGFGNYFYDLTGGQNLKNSRSIPAIQLPNKIRGGGHKRISYLGPILQRFRKSVRRFR